MRRLLTTRAILVAPAALLCLWFSGPTTVLADGVGSNCSDASCTVTATTDGNAGGVAVTGSSSTGDCTFTDEAMPTDAVTVLGVGGPQPGAWYYVIEMCPGAPDQGPFYVWVPTGPGPLPPVVVARAAMAKLRLPGPSVEMSPSRAIPQVTGLPTWLWVDANQWHPLTATASVGGVSATVTATPSSTWWDPGDGTAPFTCGGPGTPFNSSIPESSQHTDCSHAYQRSARTDNLVGAVMWHVTWSAVGAPGSGDFGLLRGGQTVIPICVTEIHALNGSAPPGGNPCT